MEIKKISPEKTHSLRHKVLRPHQELSQMQYPGDEKGTHFGAFHNQKLIGIASIYPESIEGLFSSSIWRLRGMAVDDSAQGQGVGQQIIKVILKYCQDQGAQSLWCNARIKALPFYEKLGFQRTGDLFDIPGIGDHYVAEINF